MPSGPETMRDAMKMSKSGGDGSIRAGALAPFGRKLDHKPMIGPQGQGVQLRYRLSQAASVTTFSTLLGPKADVMALILDVCFTPQAGCIAMQRQRAGKARSSLTSFCVLVVPPGISNDPKNDDHAERDY